MPSRPASVAGGARGARGARRSTSAGTALRFLRGEVLESLGRSDEAMRWYDVAAQDYNGELYFGAIAPVGASRLRSLVPHAGMWPTCRIVGAVWALGSTR